jgi:hypothetical protein
MHTFQPSSRAYLWIYSLCIFCICSLLWMFPSHCSLPTFPFPRSLPEAVSGACDSPESPPLLSLCVPFPPSPFPLFPALFPYFRLCPCPLSLFSIMFLLTFHPWWTYVTYTNCWNYNLCIKWLSEQNRQLLSMHKLCPSSYIHFQCKRVSNFGLVNSWKSPFN